MVTTIHREDVKALIRKRYGTIDAFQAAHGLNGQTVRDFFRGKSNSAKSAVAKELGVSPEHLRIDRAKVPLCGGQKKARQKSAALSSEPTSQAA